MTETPPPLARTDPSALASFVLGLASVGLCLLFLTGLPALYFGLRGLRAVNASDGRLQGRRLALAGMALGAVGTLASAVGACAILFIRLQENSRRVECSNQLRDLGITLNKHATAFGRLPPGTVGPVALRPEQRVSWFAEVLPLLAEGRPVNKHYQQLEKKIDRAQPWDSEANREAAGMTVRALLCRSHPNYRLAPVTHYVGLAGIGPEAASLKRTAPRAGAFGYERSAAFREMERGISQTLLVLETAQDNGPWLAGGPSTVRDLAPEVEQYCGAGRPFGGMHHRVTNVLWADGSVRPVSDEAPGDLLRRLVTLREQE